MVKAGLPLSKKAGHLAGLVAYGITSMAVSTGLVVVETLVSGLVHTGSQMGLAWDQMKTAQAQVPEPQTEDKAVIEVPPVRGTRPRRAAGDA